MQHIYRNTIADEEKSVIFRFVFFDLTSIQKNMVANREYKIYFNPTNLPHWHVRSSYVLRYKMTRITTEQREGVEIRKINIVKMNEQENDNYSNKKYIKA